MDTIIDIKEYLPYRYDVRIGHLEYLVEQVKTDLKESSKPTDHPLAFHAVTWKESNHELFTLYMPAYDIFYYEREHPGDDLFLATLPTGYGEGFRLMGNVLDISSLKDKVDTVRIDAHSKGLEQGPISFHIIPNPILHRTNTVWYRA